MPHVVAGKAKLLTVLGSERRPDFPDVPLPLLKEIYPALDFRVWFGIFAPLATPQSIVAAMSYAMNKAAVDPGLRQTLFEIAMVPNPGTPEGLATLLRDEYQKYGAYIRQFNISAQ